jgi:hypothetical protein
VDNLKVAVKKSGNFASIVAGVLLVYSFASMYFNLSKDTSELQNLRSHHKVQMSSKDWEAL